MKAKNGFSHGERVERLLGAKTSGGDLSEFPMIRSIISSSKVVQEDCTVSGREVNEMSSLAESSDSTNENAMHPFCLIVEKLHQCKKHEQSFCLCWHFQSKTHRIFCFVMLHPHSAGVCCSPLECGSSMARRT